MKNKAALILFVSIFSWASTNLKASYIYDEFKITQYGSFLFSSKIPNVLFFFNDIEAGDSFQLRKAIRNHAVDTVILSSPGGQVWEGLQMAGIIFDKKIKTYVPKEGIGRDGNCASACSFMFFAGQSRLAEGKLGVHQFLSKNASEEAKISDIQKTSQFTVSEIIGFLNEFETPPFVFERMFQQKEMYYFNSGEKEQINRRANALKLSEIDQINKFIKDLTTAVSELIDKEDQNKKIASKTQTPATKLVKPDELPSLAPREIVKRFQTSLNRLGCSLGKADGSVGAITRHAYATYCSKLNIPCNDQDLFSYEKLKKIEQKTGEVCKTLARFWDARYSCDHGDQSMGYVEFKKINTRTYKIIDEDGKKETLLMSYNSPRVKLEIKLDANELIVLDGMLSGNEKQLELYGKHLGASCKMYMQARD